MVLSGRSEGTRPGLLRVIFMVAALAALGFQSLVTEPHVHPLSLETAVVSAAGPSLLDTSSNQHNKSRQHPADCPLCHAQFVSGLFIGSSAAVFIPPAALQFILTHQTTTLGLVQSRSHGWNSRAPPKLA